MSTQRRDPVDLTDAHQELRARLNTFRCLLARQIELEGQIKDHLRELAMIRQDLTEAASHAAVRAADLLEHVEAHECRQRRGEVLA